MAFHVLPSLLHCQVPSVLFELLAVMAIPARLPPAPVSLFASAISEKLLENNVLTSAPVIPVVVVSSLMDASVAELVTTVGASFSGEMVIAILSSFVIGFPGVSYETMVSVSDPL